MFVDTGKISWTLIEDLNYEQKPMGQPQNKTIDIKQNKISVE